MRTLHPCGCVTTSSVHGEAVDLCREHGRQPTDSEREAHAEVVRLRAGMATLMAGHEATATRARSDEEEDLFEAHRCAARGLRVLLAGGPAPVPALPPEETPPPAPAAGPDALADVAAEQMVAHFALTGEQTEVARAISRALARAVALGTVARLAADAACSSQGAKEQAEQFDAGKRASWMARGALAKGRQ